MMAEISLLGFAGTGAKAISKTHSILTADQNKDKQMS